MTAKAPFIRMVHLRGWLRPISLVDYLSNRPHLGDDLFGRFFSEGSGSNMNG